MCVWNVNKTFLYRLLFLVVIIYFQNTLFTIMSIHICISSRKQISNIQNILDLMFVLRFRVASFWRTAGRQTPFCTVFRTSKRSNAPERAENRRQRWGSSWKTSTLWRRAPRPHLRVGIPTLLFKNRRNTTQTCYFC